MLTAKIFKSGNSQAVRLPKEYRFTDSEVGIKKVGNIVMLIPKDDEWGSFFESWGTASDDFFANGRDQGISEERESL